MVAKGGIAATVQQSWAERGWAAVKISAVQIWADWMKGYPWGLEVLCWEVVEVKALDWARWSWQVMATEVGSLAVWG